MNKANLANILKTNFIKFIDELITLFPEETDFILIRLYSSNTLSNEMLISYMTEKILPLKQMIVDKNEEFFLSNNDLFDKLNNGKVSHFKKVWTNIDDNNKQVIWSWFNCFINLTEKYLSI